MLGQLRIRDAFHEAIRAIKTGFGYTCAPHGIKRFVSCMKFYRL